MEGGYLVLDSIWIPWLTVIWPFWNSLTEEEEDWDNNRIFSSNFFEAVLASKWPQRPDLTSPLTFSWTITPLCQLSVVRVAVLCLLLNFYGRRLRRRREPVAPRPASWKPQVKNMEDEKKQTSEATNRSNWTQITYDAVLSSIDRRERTQPYSI